MTRVYFKAGEKALEYYRNKHRIITDLNQKYSSDENDLLNKIKVQDEKNKKIRQEFYLIKNALKDKVINEVLSDSGIVSDESEKPGFFVTSPGLVIREFSYLQANDLMSIARTLIEIYDKSAPSSVSKNAKAADNKSKKNPLLVLISTNENTIILAAAGAYDCGKIIKDNAHIWRGKGGGNAMSARASFPTREDLECFVTFIKQQQEAEI